MNELKFPKGFFWGASTSAHQVEGDTENNWSQWEKKNAERLAKEAHLKWDQGQREKFPEMLTAENYISAKACDHYNRFEDDFTIAKELGHNAHRFSIEWSRIEPEQGTFDKEQIAHYKKVIRSLKEKNIEPFVCLWHWTHPLWIEEKGGSESDEFPEFFSRFAKRMAEEFKEDVKFWLTINEPMSVISASYVTGNWPPQKRNLFSAWKVYGILAAAHKQSYDAIKTVSDDMQIGFANILGFFEPANESNSFDQWTAKAAEYFANKKFLQMTAGKNDFLAPQYYFHHKLAFPGKKINENKTVSDLGWEIYADGLYRVIKDMQKHKLPIYVTENGLADRDDKHRTYFIKEHLKAVHRAISEGADVRGYFYWSLLDNFEWDKGFWPRFGLVEVNFETQERKIRPSALEYKKICESNELVVE